MVVAEIPLWLVHTSDSGGSGGILGGNDAGPDTAIADAKLEHAQNSLSLLQNSGRGKKCAIYSIDINAAGTKVATCGGDGTVRIWSASALFSKKRSRFSNEGSYESSEASEESGPSDIDEHQNEQNGESNEDQGPAPENLVRDLSSFVRRKNGGVTISSPVRPTQQTTKENAAAAAPSSSSTRQASASHQQQQQQQQHRLLCTLSAHTGSSVLAVRFSHSGKYLASAGDDASVCIYRKDVSGAVGNLTEHASEHWSRIKLCRGHGLDVVGLAWAPDDSHLVSCSLDSETPIIVWKLTDLAANEGHVTHANVLCNPYKILGKGVHTSTVKGVTFDPAGSYLASSGDDPAVCIWRAHDDWGLERRIDAGSGIFRRWKEDNAQSLSSQTLFRRLSWSTDGAFICSTNCVVKNKHVASTISREGWNVSTSRSVAAGAANLVGHKQPVVVSRHCSQLLSSKSSKPENGESASSEEEQDEPSYATLLALGDRHGFVTVWSTRKSRPIFKLQCSETRCTVTDLAWGMVKDKSMLLLVSLLDGHVVALRFKIPEEIGPLLNSNDQARLFQLRYGIDVDEAGDFNRRRLFVGDNSGPKFIENALQMSLENRVDVGADDDGGEGGGEEILSGGEPMEISTTGETFASVKSRQVETQSKGKKRVRPVLMSVDDGQSQQQKKAATSNGENGNRTNGEKEKESDPLKAAAALAEKAATAADTSSSPLKRDGVTSPQPTADNQQDAPSTRAHQAEHAPHQVPLGTMPTSANPLIPYSTSRIHSVDLPAKTSKGATPDEIGSKKIIADCTTSFRIPLGSKGSSLQCIDVTLSQDGSVSWKDQIVGTACSAVAASPTALAVGTADGSLQLYGTSPTKGWSSGMAFRSHPLFVIGQPIVALQLQEHTSDNESRKLDMLIVSADGTFGVYEVLPELRLRYKGSIMPAMTHMALATTGYSVGSELRLPKLSRVQITETDRLLLLLSLSHSSLGRAATGMESPGGRNMRANAGPSSGSAYGSIQAFVYNLPMELWMRISDGRFVLSDFYSSLPGSQGRGGVLSRLDDAVRTGALDSTLTPAHRSRANDQSNDIYQQTEEKANYFATRSHCEDRMACAVAVRSSSEFKHWLSLYARTLSIGGHGDLLRVLVDMLLGTAPWSSEDDSSATGNAHWWLSSCPQVLSLDRKTLVRTVVIPAMSKNRALQRLTNEISMEIEAL